MAIKLFLSVSVCWHVVPKNELVYYIRNQVTLSIKVIWNNNIINNNNFTSWWCSRVDNQFVQCCSPFKCILYLTSPNNLNKLHITIITILCNYIIYYNLPACTAGWSVFTLPPSISGAPVTSDTSLVKKLLYQLLNIQPPDYDLVLVVQTADNFIHWIGFPLDR